MGLRDRRTPGLVGLSFSHGMSKAGSEACDG